MSGLVRYDAACRALAEAKSVDEVKDLRDKSEAMRAYAKQAKNKQLEVDAAEIRIRAERRLGEMIAEQKATVGLNKGAAAGGQKEGPRGSYVAPRDTAPTLAEAGIDKKLSARAQKMAAVPADEFESMVGEWRDRVEAENERVTTNLLKAGEKKLARDEKEAALADKMRAAAENLGQGVYGVVYADPPWRFEPYSRGTGMDRAADNHYPTMGIDDIVALNVPAADDCVLFLWATAPMMPDALNVLLEWGFEYKSQIVWVKDRIGTGYWARNKHEILLIGTRGHIPAPAPGTQPESAIVAPVGAHSAKPGVFSEIIEKMFPNLPKIELFARTTRPGWAGWGAEYEFQAKASEDNGATGEATMRPADSMTGEVSRVDAGRTASATSERMDATAGETASNSNPQPTSSPEADKAASAPPQVGAATPHRGHLDPGPMPSFLRRTAEPRP